MMRPLLLSGALFVFAAMPALAQDPNSTITIIHEDGSKDVIDLRNKANPNSPARIPEPVKPAPSEVAPQPDAANIPQVAVEPEPILEEDSIVPEPRVVHAPVEDDKAKAQPKVEPPKAKPAPPEKAAVTPPPMPVQRKVQGTLEPDQNISRQAALAIALDYAPPSMDMNMFLVDYQGREVYAAIFKTEDGFHEVLVDPRTGTVLESQASSRFDNRAARPGTLPQQLR